MHWFNTLPGQEDVLDSPCRNACVVSFYHRKLPVQDGSPRTFLEGLDDQFRTQATAELTRAGARLDLTFTNKEDLTGWDRGGWEQPWHSGSHGMEFRLLSGGEKAQSHDHSPGLPKSRLRPLQRSAWKNPGGHPPGEKRGPGVMAEFQGSPPPSSRMVHPHKQRRQEAPHGRTRSS